MPYNSEIHHRRSIRLTEYDYSKEGFYFVTICTHTHKPLFGKIIDGTMHLNKAGLMVEKWFDKCTEHFQDIECLEKIIMPNHIHCIWHNTGEKQTASTEQEGSLHVSAQNKIRQKNKAHKMCAQKNIISNTTNP